MILKGPHVINFKENWHRKNGRKTAKPRVEVMCDKCLSIFTERVDVFFKRVDIINKEYCGKCARPLMCSIAGFNGTHYADGNIKLNSGNFSTERWNKKTDEEKVLQVNRASKGLQEKLKDPIYAAQHFAKVFAQTRVGYMSKGHTDLHSFIEELGFESHVQIGQMQVDECNETLKIVIEYNGDMWHCNPRKYKASDYNSAIRMTAGEKWQKDIARHKMLKSIGYTTIVIWESAWIENARKQINKIKDLCDEISEKKRNSN